MNLISADLLSEFLEFASSVEVKADRQSLEKALSEAQRKSYAVEKTAGPHSYSSTQLSLEGDLREQVLDLIDLIPEEFIIEKETDPHITVKYGLHSDDPAEVIRLVSNTGAITCRIGNVSCFTADDDGNKRTSDNYDVVKLDVESESLKKLNAILSSLPHTDTHSGYSPHITLAYVQAGMGERISNGLKGIDEDVTFDTLEFSASSGDNRTQIRLSGSGDYVGKALNRAGGEKGTIPSASLIEADFITLPEGIPGTNCGNCKFKHVNKPSRGGETICLYPKLRGQLINQRNCCKYWDAEGVIRDWKIPNNVKKANINIPGTCKPGQTRAETGCQPSQITQGPRNMIPDQTTSSQGSTQPDQSSRTKIILYRGMSQEAFKRLQETGVYTPEPNNPHNDASKDPETAAYYASTKVHDDPGVVIRFETDIDNVKEDDVYRGDFKVIRPIKMDNYRVVN